MEFRMTRRDSVTGALLLGLTATFSASRANASEDKQVVDASCLADLTDDELVLLEQMVAGEKRRRDVKSIQMQAGMYVAGVDIDPGHTSFMSVRKTAQPVNPKGVR